MYKDEDQEFELLPGDEMREKYGLYAENRPLIHLNPNNVPIELHPLICLAEIWGISDDLIREDFISKASQEDLYLLKVTVESNIGLLEAWLAGPAAQGPEYTDEYIAFTSMLMASDTVDLPE